MWDALTSLNYSRKHGATSKNCTLSLSIRDWDIVTWKQVGHPLVGTLIASASSDSHSRLRWPSDRQDIAIFQHSALWSSDVTIHIDGKHVLSGGCFARETGINGTFPLLISCPFAILSAAKAQISISKILALNTKPVTILTLNCASSTIFANRSRAKLEQMLWEDALLDAQKVIELEPLSHVGYQLKHMALHGAQRYIEAIEALKVMHAKLASAHNLQTRKLRNKSISPFEVGSVIRKAIILRLDSAPLRLLDTTTGLLCDREAQISAFKTSTEYNGLLLSIMAYPDLPLGRIKDTMAMYFCYVMLSHRWGENEPLLHDIQDKVVYKLKGAGGLTKLQSFCKLVRHLGYHWAWVGTCCIDQSNSVELQNHSTPPLTVVYLSDVPSSSKSGALAKSAWNTRGWTVPEFLAPKVIRFYQQDWTLYLDDHSPNHKESVEIMLELEDATGIDAHALVAFQPGMRDAREKLRWASSRVTTVPEDIAYSLFGIFGIQLPILYGENALGRLLQEIIARSGDITALDWIGQPSEFNSCLPADITSYAAPPCALPYLSEDEIQTALANMSYPRFTNCRLRLPCIIFPVTEVRRRSGATQETLFTYGVKADGLDDLLITTEEKLIQFSRFRPTRQTFLLVRTWDRRLLELPDFADDVESLGGWSEPESLDGSPGEEELADPEFYSQALRLIARLGQPFGAFLLAQQRTGEYKRIASDHDIIAQVKDVTSAHSMMDIRTLEIL
ncbi:hypothetical protein BD769DRAFT_1397416 [Suillus cothurnatus]|nr:hypothetical protein BD769DRAFT_1397416 [Suillus cothurnatus]